MRNINHIFPLKFLILLCILILFAGSSEDEMDDLMGKLDEL